MDDIAGPIRILSDLHLGHPACRLKSVEPLRAILQGAGTVIFNGDTWEQGNSFLKKRAEKPYRELLDLLDELAIAPLFICGNHDPMISDLDWLDLSGGSVFVTHGDCLFETISPWNPITWKLKVEYDRVRREIPDSDLASLMNYTRRCRLIGERDEHKFRSGRLRILRSVFKIACPPRRPWEILRCWKETPGRVDRLRKNHLPNPKTIIIGHVHRPGIWKRADGYTLINTGGFMSVGKAQLVELNGDDVSVFTVDESNPKEFSLKLKARI